MFAATAFGRILVENDTPTAIANALLSMTDSLALIWLVVILFLILIGMFMETLATIMIVTPVLLPVMVQFGVDQFTLAWCWSVAVKSVFQRRRWARTCLSVPALPR